ncbi:FAD/NAD(P)-binding oxidoreductase [Spongiactinospora gelatinilytica]|uniref:FAD/NAD(P)-binding oxidoreductase n=1 Tax=Spongiactinospora gelatinilytica TaxID=2666298 RepID=A0A2W2GMQ4_9ACTN|nr:FAD-dependent oxidoreductase [Spongiactinospora gelatinilytica]PZG50786.1 FAD/NAD(P)-binding oxidoreductase [Spongiactinospora gelatinilytica]
MSPRAVVIVGAGMAGMRLADEIRRRDPDGERVQVTVLGAEPGPAYNRVLLPGVLAGTMSAASVTLYPQGWAEDHHIDLREGVEARAIDTAARTVGTACGAKIPFDALVLATGAEPRIPPTEGLSGEDGTPARGVVAFRTLADCLRISADARPGVPITVIGGGLLGLEAARSLAVRGCAVTVVHPVGHLMERQLDTEAGAVLAKALTRHGVRFRIGRTAARYLPGDGLKLDDGSHVPAELVVVAAGVRARTGLAEAAGLPMAGGVVVDDTLRTAHPAVYAIGDVARHPGATPGLVEPAWEQADVLAGLLTGTDPQARYRGTTVVTRLKARGVDLTAMGETTTDPDDEIDEALRLSDPARGRYAKLVLRDDRVRAAIMLGLPDAAASAAYYYTNDVPVPEDRLAVLLGRALPPAAPAQDPATLADTATVCRCNHVTKAQLTAAWRTGAADAAELSARTRAGTGCGTCVPLLRGIAGWLAGREQEAS